MHRNKERGYLIIFASATETARPLKVLLRNAGSPPAHSFASLAIYACHWYPRAGPI
jgi:hypothetical protein